MSQRRNRTTQESNKSLQEVEDNIERVIEIDNAIYKDLEEEEEEVDLLEQENIIYQHQKDQHITLNSDGTKFKSDKIFLGDEDRKLFNKANKELMDRLGLASNRSIKI